MKKLIFFLVFFSSFLVQAQFQIQGTIHNQENQPIDLAEVYLFNPQKELLQNIYTDPTGFFQFSDIKGGAYLLQIHYFGTQVLEKNLNIDHNTDLKTLKVDIRATLDEIVLEARAKLVERQVDRLVFNVENSVTALGGDALDAMKNTPGLTVSNQAVSIAGKSSVSVMIDDRILQMSGEDLMNYLKSVPAANIKKIEVITNPPAKYDAAGNSGLINIVLKEAKQNAWSTTLRSSYRKASFGGLNDGLNFSYDKNKLSALVDLYHYDGKGKYTNDINFQYPKEDWQEANHTKNHYNGFGGLVTLNYKFDEKNKMGLQFNGGKNHNKNTESDRVHSYNDANLVKDYLTKTHTKNNNHYQSLNLNFDHKIDSLGKKISVDLDYWGNSGNTGSDFISDMNNLDVNQHSLTNAVNNNDQDLYNVSGKLDFYMPYSFGVLEYGLKTSHTNTEYTLDSNFTNAVTQESILAQKDAFKYSENSQAIYASFSKNLSDQWMAKIGLRGEYTQTEGNSIKNNQINKNDYFKVFPTVYFQYKPNDNHSFNANFGRRIQRPGYWEMNPNRWYTNANSYSEGNPFLQPAFVYNFELNYGFQDYLHAKLYYQNEQDGYGQITFHDTEKQTQIYKRINYYKGNKYGLTLSSTIAPFPWLESNNEFGFSINESKNNIPELAAEFSGSNAYFRSFNSLTFNADKTFLGEVNFRYSFAGKVREYTFTPESYLDLGVKKLFLDKKLTIGLAVEDIFKKDQNTLSYEIQGIKQSFSQYYDTRLVRISASYRFGNSKISVSQRQTSNQEESGRGGK